MTTHDIDTLAESGLSTAAWYYDDTVPAWRAANVSPGCQLTVPSGDGVTQTTIYSWPDAGNEPPAIIQSVIDDSAATASTAPTIPAADIGLAPPRITELLPNPTGTGNEDTEEFIELYNPNAKAFDLSGFVLQTGLSTKHSYTFPAGTLLPAHAFSVFFSADTGLSLSNTGSQANLNDPLGTTVAQTDPYTSAKDGQAWALANGTWYWTVKPTPAASNVIAAPIVSTKNGLSKATAAKKTTATTSVKGASTTKPTASTAAAAAVNETAARPAVHTGLLAVVAVAGVGYVLYEYRQDVANAFDKLRRNRSTRR